MRNPLAAPLLPALLCGAALLASGCRRSGENRAGQALQAAPLQLAEARAPAAVPAVQPASALAPAPEPAREEPRTVFQTVSAGTRLEAELTRTLASNTSSPGDSFRARVRADVVQGGRVVIPRGSEILGEVTEAVPLPRIDGQARLALQLTDLVLPSGRSVPVAASFVQEERSEAPGAAAGVGGVAAGGAILGRILGPGAAAGTAIASKTPGEEVVIPEGAVVSLRLDGAVRVPAQAS